MKRKLETDLKKTVMPLTYGFSWLQEVILYSKITKVSNMEGSFKMMQSFFLHNSFSIIQAMGQMKRNLETGLKNIVMPFSYGFSWLQEVILYSKITSICDMEDSFENDSVIFLCNSFSIIQAMGLNEEKP